VTTKEILKVDSLSKSFGAVQALSNVSLTFYESEIHAVLGQNGAGKSTLVKIITGLYPTSSATGVMVLNGEEIKLKNVADARKKGIGYVPQEIEIVDNLTVAENIFAGQLPTSGGVFSLAKIMELARELIEKYDFNLPIEAFAGALSTAQRQTLMIARALASNPSILILDEPTTSLSKEDASTLAKNLLTLKRNKVTMIYITHRIPEVMNLCDRATVLRDGKVELVIDKSEFSSEKIITAMIGRRLVGGSDTEKNRNKKKTILELKNAKAVSKSPQSVTLSDISFKLGEGEVVGLAGLVGSGRSEILDLIAGRNNFEGSYELDGESISNTNPSEMRERGVILLTEDRKREGLLFNLNLVKNVTAGSISKYVKYGIIDGSSEFKAATDSMQALSVKTRNYLAEPSQLSGGNQQKLLLARALLAKPKILLLDEPTKGVDIGARQEIYNIINDVKKNGTGVILVSSDLDELLLLADRVVVVARGTTVDEFSRGEGDEARVLRFGTGVL
jgi:ribose transport system ATP-binding protein/D-xylose transport system ATP-binding protein